MSNLLAAKWLAFRNACYPPDKIKLHPVQEVEVRQAFFAGCLEVANAVNAAAMLEDKAAEKHLSDLFGEIIRECESRAHQIKQRN